MVRLAASMLMAVGCASHGRWDPSALHPASGEFAALVDSEPARLLLADLVTRDARDPRLAARAPMTLGNAHPARPDTPIPDQAWLRALAEEVSLDFAALTFARALGADDRSRAVQAAYDRFLQEGAARAEEALRAPAGFPYTVLFAPSWLYRSHPEHGADFGRQRRLLDRLGIANRLIETAESGSVEDNAATIAAAVREAGRRAETVILVSASKSGAEIALALSRLVTAEEAASVAAWLNVAGALRGTPLADAALRPPTVWLTRAVFWLAGWNGAGLSSMTTRARRDQPEGRPLPGRLAVVNLIAVPVSRSVGPRTFLGYQKLSGHGPNDGVVLLADTVWPGGANVVALGADHLLTPLREEAHGLALMRAIDFAVRLQDAVPGTAGVTTRRPASPALR